MAAAQRTRPSSYASSHRTAASFSACILATVDLLPGVRVQTQHGGHYAADQVTMLHLVGSPIPLSWHPDGTVPLPKTAVTWSRRDPYLNSKFRYVDINIRH
ncbi:hypothetical protein BDR07DRAFT_599921 [Suillus spraguei]|nr:hypothetical protein BDR07DRAFT_599921 [Suillus spraguei]